MRQFGFLAVLLVPLHAFAGPAEDVAAVERSWSEAFARNDWGALAALYTEDATLYGTKPELSAGRDAVRAYYDGLPKGVFKGARFDAQVVRQVTADVLTASGPVTFEREVGGQKSELAFRITLVLVRQDGNWRIAAHHASPR